MVPIPSLPLGLAGSGNDRPFQGALSDAPLCGLAPLMWVLVLSPACVPPGHSLFLPQFPSLTLTSPLSLFGSLSLYLVSVPLAPSSSLEKLCGSHTFSLCLFPTSPPSFQSFAISLLPTVPVPVSCFASPHLPSPLCDISHLPTCLSSCPGRALSAHSAAVFPSLSGFA